MNAAARRKWGQHWLANDDLARALVRAIAPRPGDRFVEIGPGRGRLTRALLRHPVAVVAVEIDPACCRLLRRLAAETAGRDADLPSLRVVEAGILDVDPASLGVDSPLRLAGNLPYNIASPILRWTALHRPLVEDAHYMLPADVADRVLAPPGASERGLLSVQVQWGFAGAVVRKLGPGAFRPPPRIDSAFLRLSPRPEPSCAAPAARRHEVLAAAFAHRRKTLARGLVLAGWPSASVEAALDRAGIPPRARPQELDREEFARLVEALGEATS